MHEHAVDVAAGVHPEDARGALASHFRIGSPLFTHVLFAVYVAAFLWGGLALRNPRLLSLLIDAR